MELAAPSGRDRDAVTRSVDGDSYREMLRPLVDLDVALARALAEIPATIANASTTSDSRGLAVVSMDYGFVQTRLGSRLIGCAATVQGRT